MRKRALAAAAAMLMLAAVVANLLMLSTTAQPIEQDEAVAEKLTQTYVTYMPEPVIRQEEPERDMSAWTETAAYIAKAVYGEAMVCGTTERAAVVWCILNRADDARDATPAGVIAVVTKPYQFHGYANNAIRNQVAETIEQSGNWGQAGSFLYQTGMSMGDFLLNTAITGGFGGGGALSEGMSLAIMGTGAAADATIAAKDRGLTDTQAFTLGTIAGAAEVFTEKFSIEALLKGKWEDGAIKYILKNAFTEGAEEVGSDFINLFADILIAKDMNMAAAKGANVYGITPETLAATATQEYKTVDEMHADEARLRTVSEEEHAKALRDLGIYLDRVVNDLMLTTMHKYDNSFEEEQNLSGIIAEAAKGKKTTAAVKAAFRKEGYAISDGHAKSILALIDRAANIPTGYYEAKAQRVVPFSEAAAIIAPTSAPAEEIAAVKAATGVNIICRAHTRRRGWRRWQWRCSSSSSAHGCTMKSTNISSDADRRLTRWAS